MSSIKTLGKNILRTLVMAFCFVALAVAMTACNEEAKITLIKVDTTASTLTVEQGGTINDLNIVVKGYYDDGKSISIDVDDEALSFSQLDTSQAGVFPLTVSYVLGEGETATTLTDTVSVTVTKKVKSIAFATNSGLPEYVEEGQSIDVTKIKLIATYLDDTTATISYNANVMTVTQDTSVAGKITVTVAYRGVEQTISKDVVIKSVVEIQSATITNAFYQYQPASYDTTQIHVLYSTDEEETINYNANMSFSGVDMSTAGEQTLTITYAGKTIQKQINVIALDSITYKNGLNMTAHYGLTPEETRYSIRKGGTLNLKELVVVAKYVTGTGDDDYVTFDVATKTNDDLTVDALNTQTAEEKTLTIRFHDKTDVLPVVVTEVVSISCQSATAYQYQPVSNKNVLVQAIDSIGDIYDISEGVELILDTSEAGVHEMQIHYEDALNGDVKNTTYNVNVYGVKTGAGVDSIKYESGLPKKVVQGSTIALTGLKITVLYDDAIEVEDCNSFSLKYNEAYMDVADATTTTIGENTLTIYLTIANNTQVSTTYTYNVVEQINQDEIIGFEDPEFVTTYSKTIAKNTYTSTGSNGIKGFEITNNPFLVGCQNAWFYKPIAHTENTDENGLQTYATEVKVYLNGSSTPLTDEQLAEYVVIDTLETQSYQFSTEAINKIFKIEVSPLGQADEFVSTFTFTVVDAYNVYNARDLSVFDNTNSAGKWTALKTEWGIPLDLDVHSIVLQNNISITKDVVPEGFFWKASELGGRDAAEIEAMTGSFKDNDSNDYGYIYKRMVTDGSTFKFEGNYFKVSVDKLPLIVEDDGHNSTYRGNPITVHSTVFGFYGDETLQNVTNYEINNTEFYGNTQKSEAAVDSGGIICFKKKDCKMTVNNILSQRWFISLFQREGRDESSVEAGDAMIDMLPMILNNVNAFDAYNTLIYNWGGKIYINNSHLIGAGGPVMICDHTSHGNNPAETGTISNVVVDNSVLESWIAGSEGWFTAYAGAGALATSMKSLDQVLAGIAQMSGGAVNKTFLNADGQKMNLIAVYKSGSVAGLTTVAIRGKLTDVTEGAGYTNGLDLPLITKLEQLFILAKMAELGVTPDNPAYEQTLEAVTTEIKNNFKQIVVMQTFNGVMLIPTDPLTALVMTDTAPYIQQVDLTDNAQLAGLMGKVAVASGYLNIYLFNGMGAVVSLENR